MSYSSSSAAAVYGGANRNEEETTHQRFARLDLAFCSSQDAKAPAQNLQTRRTLQHDHHQSTESVSVDGTGSTREYPLPVLHGGWESEKFCEYPQELVFRVNRWIPTQIDSLHILSHHAKIASRVEVFTSSTPLRQLRECNAENRAAAEFQRLGFVSFQSNETTDFSSRELKIVHLETREKITLIRLVLHRCHANRQNLFQQVGLLSVVASAQKSLHSSASWSPVKTGFLPSLHPHAAAEEQQVGPCGESTDHLFASSLSPLRAKYAANLVALCTKSPAKKVASAPALLLQPSSENPMRPNGDAQEYAVWVPELREFRTPLQIVARVKLCRELANQSGSTTRTARLWRSLDLESRRLLNSLDILQRAYDDTSHLVAVDDRIAMHEEIGHVVQDLGALGSEAFADGLEIVKQENGVAQSHRGLETENWRTREELVWKVVEHLRKVCADDKAKPSPSSTSEEEALGIAKQVLRDDSHSQVFIAGCSLLQLVLANSNTLQERASLSNHLAEVLDVLLQRLDGRQAVIRNNAAFYILKAGLRYRLSQHQFQIAELSRAKGTFVMHFILKKLEGSKQKQKQFYLSDQVLHALLKLFSALLFSSHCCQSIDIAPRRILTFLLESDADMHANPHIRDAAKQLTLVMYNEVGAEIMESYLSKLPSEVQEMHQLQFKLSDEKNKNKNKSKNKGIAITNEAGAG